MNVFVFLDSWRKVPQRTQHLLTQTYAKNNDLKIVFYGDELYGTENRHEILLDYISSQTYDAFLFYSIHQFDTPTTSEIDLKLLEKIVVDMRATLFFALEEIAFYPDSFFKADYLKIQISNRMSSLTDVQLLL